MQHIFYLHLSSDQVDENALPILTVNTPPKEKHIYTGVFHTGFSAWGGESKRECFAHVIFEFR